MYTKQQITLVADNLGRKLAEAMQPYAARTCLDCTHFDEKTELCKLAQQRPPARVIVNGCEGYDEKIPF